MLVLIYKVLNGLAPAKLKDSLLAFLSAGQHKRPGTRVFPMKCECTEAGGRKRNRDEGRRESIKKCSLVQKTALLDVNSP